MKLWRVRMSYVGRQVITIRVAIQTLFVSSLCQRIDSVAIHAFIQCLLKKSKNIASIFWQQEDPRKHV